MNKIPTVPVPFYAALQDVLCYGPEFVDFLPAGSLLIPSISNVILSCSELVDALDQANAAGVVQR